MKVVNLSISLVAVGFFISPAYALSGNLQLTKECSEYSGKAGAFCTVTASNCTEIPAGSKIVYNDAPLADGGADTDLVIETPDGDLGYGHVVLDGATETGTVTLSGGTGALEKLSGELAVAPLEPPNYNWEGPYSY